ncbi:MAG: histidine kinase [Bacteroidia bacterium]|nr:histidine kinase [Bacteroidia bacterium]
MNRLLLVPVIVAATVLFSSALIISQMFLEDLFGWKNFSPSGMDPFPVIVNVINLTFVFIFWTLIYFLVHYFENYRKAEIEKLQWAASINEIELNKLKSQLNPHFIFNSMNSIRALVDEDPEKAKNSITQLSNILRLTLLMGKKKVISFAEEMTIVKDYLSLELTRFEERLRVSYEIGPGSEKFEVPPLMLQTLVENGIKHGISRLPGGGELKLKTTVCNGMLEILIVNSGTMNGKSEGTGFGIKSTEQRLHLLYGSRGKFDIRENAATGTVECTVTIPDVTVT